MAKKELTPINNADGKIIEKIEKLVGKELEQVAEIEWDTLGYAVDKTGTVTVFSFCHFPPYI